MENYLNIIVTLAVEAEFYGDEDRIFGSFTKLSNGDSD